MKQIIDFEFQFCNVYFLSTELILQLNKFVLEFYSHFSLVIQIVFVLLFSLLELLSLVFKHVFNLTKILIFIPQILH